MIKLETRDWVALASAAAGLAAFVLLRAPAVLLQAPMVFADHVALGLERKVAKRELLADAFVVYTAHQPERRVHAPQLALQACKVRVLSLVSGPRAPAVQPLKVALRKGRWWGLC